MAWGGPEEDDEAYNSVGSALADPAGTYADENGAAPEETPKIKDGSPSTVEADAGDSGDEETNRIAGNQPAPATGHTELDDVPQSAPKTELDYAQGGDSGDEETAALMGGAGTYKAPAPLELKPYEDHSADEQALVDMKAKEDPSKYRPSGWRRAGAAIAAGLVGFGTDNAGEAMNVANRMKNAPLDRAKEQWAAQEAPLKQKIEADKAADQQVTRDNTNTSNMYSAQERNLTNQARVDSWNALAQQRKAQAAAKLNTVDKNTMGPVDPKNPYGEWQAKTPNGQVVRGLEPPAAIQKDPRFIAQQRRQQLSDMANSGVKLTPQEAKYFLINGKLAEPSQRTTISIRENPDGSAVQPGAGRGGGPKNPDANVSAIVAKSIRDKDAFTNKYQRNDDGSYGNIDNPTQGLAGPEFQAKVDKFRTDANAKLAKYGKAIDDTGQIVDAPTAQGGQPQGTPAIPAAAPAQKPAAAQPAQAAAPQGIEQFPQGKTAGTRSIPIPGGALDIPEKALPDVMSGKLKLKGNKGETLVFKDGKFELEQKKS